ncbi:MAG: hypothetical protein KBG20_00130 [Caldilineaceae bacterium]|nr:hypothetical protein [Caldilineaceae bacterium]MBP8107243.1 hypothetical protein [Caldilineaceae bacterium]MBP8121359.1 hypothetical protein [Caldilineaceae bacterium]MBP9070664.1 hypothetical protein [Caldilineaceae bacterium]
MDPISLVVFIVLIGGASIYLDRKWQVRKLLKAEPAPEDESPAAEGAGAEGAGAEAQGDAASFLSRTSNRALALGSQAVDRAKVLGVQASSQTKALGAQAAGQAQSLRERFPVASKESPLPTEFRTWVMAAAGDDADLKRWLSGLGDEQFADFTGHVDTFCISVGFELAWLVNGEFDKMPGLVANAAQVVTNYCRSCAQAAAAQIELNGFRDYRDYLQSPDSRKGRVYGEKLLDHLLAAGMTTVSLSDFLGVSAKTKQEHVLQAIQSAAEKNPTAFNRALIALSAAEPSPAPQAEPTPAAAAA